MNEKHPAGPGHQESDGERRLAPYTDALPQYANQGGEGRGGGGQGAAGPAFSTTFACLSLHMTDRIRLLRFPIQDIAQIEGMIRREWKKGIQNVSWYDQAKEFKLSGTPWAWTGGLSGDKQAARRLMLKLLGGLFDMGWILKAAVDVNRKKRDKDSLLLRHQLPPPPACTWMSISFDKTDIMRIGDGPSDFCLALVQACQPRVQSHSVVESLYEIKFRGTPWRPMGKETVQTRLLILEIMDCLEAHGFSLYGSIDLENGPTGDSPKSTADVWFCNRPVSWAPGMPVYHS